MKLTHLVLLLVLSGLPSIALADEPGRPESAPERASGKSTPDKSDHDEKGKTDDALLNLLPPDSVTQHSIQLNGQKIGYSATAGTLTLRNEKGERSAAVFYVAYAEQGANPVSRPVSFFFNGGPGAGSAYLHLGAAGPMVLDFPSGDETDGADAKLRENPSTWLAFTDMVFIDAVGTGWSRAAKPEDAAKEFWGVKQDAVAFAKVVSLWLEKNGRTQSPKYLVGESYGGIRSVKVARELQDSESILLDGITMISPAINMDFVGGDPDNPLIDALRLPSFVAGHLQRTHQFSAEAVENAYRFGTGDYLQTIVGPVPSGDAATGFYTKIAQMTGVPEEVVARQRGRLDPESHDVRSQDGRLFSVYDDTLTIADPFPEGGDHRDDPVLWGYTRAYGNAFTGYAAEQLGFKTDLTYKLLALNVNAKWDYESEGHRLPAATDDLKRLLALDPKLKLFVAGGYYDLVCPFEINRWLLDHLTVGRDRITFKVYQGGHMIYTRPASRAALEADVATMYAAQPTPR